MKRILHVNTLNASSLLPISAVIVPTLLLSLYVLPQSAELGLIDAEAGRVGSAVERLESAVETGRNLPTSVAALAEARAELGDPVGSLALLLDLAEERPRDPRLLAEIARHYKGLARAADEAATIERIQAITPSTDNLRRLLDLATEIGDDAKRHLVLSELIEGGSVVVDDYVELAGLMATEGDLTGAALVLADVPDGLSRVDRLEALALEIALLVDGRRPAHALERAQSVLSTDRFGDDDILNLSRGLFDKRYFALVGSLLSGLPATLSSERLTALQVMALDESGRRDDALAALGRLREGKLAGKGIKADSYLEAAIAVRSQSDILTAARRVGFGELTQMQIGPAAAAAVTVKDTGAASEILALGRKTLKLIDPIMVAELFATVGDLDEARRKAVAARSSTEGNPDRALYLADLMLRLEARGDAIAVLSSTFPTDSEVPDWVAAVAPEKVDDLAYLFLRAERPEQGFQVIGRLRDSAPGETVERAWALVAMASGHGRAVGEWYANAPQDGMDIDYLVDLRNLSFQQDARPVVAHVARSIVEKRGSDMDKMFLAGALIADGRPLPSSLGRKTLER
jgi:hypothetical protein